MRLPRHLIPYYASGDYAIAAPKKRMRVAKYKIFSELCHYKTNRRDQSSDTNPPIAKFRGKGKGIVEKPNYIKTERRVYFNESQYFEGISTEVWEYQIGGYKICHKWLKDRKGRTLSTDDIKHYCRIATAIQKTIEIQKEIDRIYPEMEIDTVEFY